MIQKPQVAQVAENSKEAKTASGQAKLRSEISCPKLTHLTVREAFTGFIQTLHNFILLRNKTSFIVLFPPLQQNYSELGKKAGPGADHKIDHLPTD